MLPAEKKQALDIIKQHDSRWSPSCVSELHTACKIPLADMHLLQTCISLAIANPGHLDRGVPTDEERRSSSRTLPEVAEEAETARNDATVGLNSWRLHPAGMTGLDKFEHMIEYRKKNPEDPQKISSSLGIDVDDPFQQALLSNEPIYDKMGAHMKNIGDGKKLIGSRVLNALGGIQGHSEVLNDPVRIGRMRERAELMKSLESIRENTAVAEVNKKNEDLAEVLPDLPAAVERFKRGENVKVKLLRGILLACYDVDMPKSGKKKEEYEKKLKELVASRPFKLDIHWAAFGRTLASQIPAAAASTAAAAPAPSNNGSEQDEVDLGAANDDGAVRMGSL